MGIMPPDGPTTVLALVADAQTARKSVTPRRPAEPLVVLAVELEPLLRPWIARHDEDHPRTRIAMRPGERVVRHFSAVRFLCQEAEISGARLNGILEHEPPYTYLSVADALLKAMGVEHLLATGDVRIFANPTWPRRRVIRELTRLGCDIAHPFWHETMNGHVEPQPDYAMIRERARAQRADAVALRVRTEKHFENLRPAEGNGL